MIDNEIEMPFDMPFNEPYDLDSTKEISELLYFIERSQSFSSDYVNNRTYISEKEMEVEINNNAINCLSSNHDKNSINSQNNNDPRYFTKTKENSSREKHKIFSIEKKQRIKRKLDVNQKKNSKYPHTKYSEDNIVTKVKTYFVNSLIKYINIRYSKLKGKENLKLLKKAAPKFAKVYSKKKNQDFLRLSVKQFISMEISKRCHDSPDHNEKQIAKLYKEKESEEFTELLDSKLSDMYEIYIEKDIPEFSLKNDLKNLKEKKKEINDYLVEYEKVAKRLIPIMSKKGKMKNRKFLCKKIKPSKKNKKNDLSDFSDDSKSG